MGCPGKGRSCHPEFSLFICPFLSPYMDIFTSSTNIYITYKHISMYHISIYIYICMHIYYPCMICNPVYSPSFRFWWGVQPIDQPRSSLKETQRRAKASVQQKCCQIHLVTDESWIFNFVWVRKTKQLLNDYCFFSQKIGRKTHGPCLTTWESLEKSCKKIYTPEN